MKLSSRLLQHPLSLVWVLMAYLPGLGASAVALTGDQRLYLATAMEMDAHGSWLRPLLFGAPSYYKPPFQYWATLMGWKLFGFTLSGAVLPSVLALLGTAYFLGEISRILGVKRESIRSGLWFAALLGALTYGTTVQMEIWLCFFSIGTSWAGLRYWESRDSKRALGWLFLSFGLAGLSSLVKSPLYAVFSVLSFLTFGWARFGFREVVRPRVLAALGFGVLVGLAWFLFVLHEDGAAFWRDYVLRESWEKKGGNGSSFLGIWTALLYLGFPATAFAFAGVAGLLRSRTEVRSRRLLAFGFAWTWPAALFFSLYPYRVTTYLFPLAPVLALLADEALSVEVLPRWRRGAEWITAVAFLGGLALVAGGGIFFGAIPVALSLALLVTAFFGATLLIRRRASAFPVAGLVAVLLLRLVSASLGEQDVEGLKSFARQYPQGQWHILDQEKNIWNEVAFLSLAVAQPIQRHLSVASLLGALRGAAQRGADSAKVILTEEQWSQLQGQLPFELRAVEWRRLPTRREVSLREWVDQPTPLLRRPFRLLEVIFRSKSPSV